MPSQSRIQWIRPFCVRLVLSMSSLVALFAAMSLPASAAPLSAKSVPAPIAKHTVGMNVDCLRVPNTAQAHAVLAAHDLCGYGKTRGSVSPDNSISGNCGTLSLYVFDSGNGVMQWKGEVTSSLGPMISISYSGSWANLDLQQSDTVNRGYSGFTSDWNDIFSITTGPGQVFGRIDGASDTLWFGGSCSGGGPVTDYTYVN